MEKTIAFCGLVCNDCPAYAATLNNDIEAKKQIAESWSTDNNPLTPEEIICHGCTGTKEKVLSFCAECDIRKCGLNYGIKNCGLCFSYPCSKLDKVFARTPGAREVLANDRISEVKKRALDLITKSGVALLGLVDENGYPNIKAMLNLEYEGLDKIWFSTNTSSKKVAKTTENPKACVYYVDQKNFKGVLLTGDLKVLKDKVTKTRLWREGFEKYYPLGIDDPDYCVLEFTPKKVDYYPGAIMIDL